jgi:anthranilate synthase/aminodeoxychorismate synthase-like glutamine amidotransferase
MLLIIDHYDSFIDMIVDYCKQLDAEYVVVKTDQINDNIFTTYEITHIIIGPGPGHPNDSTLDATRQILHYAIQHQIAVLGICLGHQIIASYFGANIEYSTTIAHGKISLCTNHGSGIFATLPTQFNVTRYHSLTVNANSLNLNNEIYITATANDDGKIMAIQHNIHNIYGVQFHPESIMTDFGLEMLVNFLNS